MPVSDRSPLPIIMGIDPGIATTGYGILQGKSLIAAGSIRTRAQDPEAVRYAILFRDLLEAMREHSVDEVAVEKFIAFYGTDPSSESSPQELSMMLGRSRPSKRKSTYDRPDNPDSLYKMKGAQSVALLAGIVHGATVFEYTLQQWKGNAKRSKKEIREMVRLLYKVDIANHNITDGIGIATHHVTAGRLSPDAGSSLALPLSLFAGGGHD